MPENTPSLPDFTRWPSFPFEGDMRVKKLAAPVEVEPPRSGEDAADCVACNTPDDAYIWVSERWRVRGMDRPTGLPMVLILECRSHLDIGDLPNLLAAELGVMTVRLERAIRTLDGVARVHVNRWGDGSAHLHMWFLARPYGRLQLRGTFLSLWDDILPVISEEQWLENLALVAAWLGEFGGRAIAEPPHIHWLSPSTFSTEPTTGTDSTDSAAAWRPADLADADSDMSRSTDSDDVGADTDADTGDLSDVAAHAAAMADAAASAAGLGIQDSTDEFDAQSAAAISDPDGRGHTVAESSTDDDATGSFGIAGGEGNGSSAGGPAGGDGTAGGPVDAGGSAGGEETTGGATDVDGSVDPTAPAAADGRASGAASGDGSVDLVGPAGVDGLAGGAASGDGSASVVGPPGADASAPGAAGAEGTAGVVGPAGTGGLVDIDGTAGGDRAAVGTSDADRSGSSEVRAGEDRGSAHGGEEDRGGVGTGVDIGSVSNGSAADRGDANGSAAERDHEDGGGKADSGPGDAAGTGAVAPAPSGVGSQAISAGAIPQQYRSNDGEPTGTSGERKSEPEGATTAADKSTATIAGETR